MCMYVLVVYAKCEMSVRKKWSSCGPKARSFGDERRRTWRRVSMTQRWGSSRLWPPTLKRSTVWRPCWSWGMANCTTWDCATSSASERLLTCTHSLSRSCSIQFDTILDVRFSQVVSLLDGRGGFLGHTETVVWKGECRWSGSDPDGRCCNAEASCAELYYCFIVYCGHQSVQV